MGNETRSTAPSPVVKAMELLVVPKSRPRTGSGMIGARGRARLIHELGDEREGSGGAGASGHEDAQHRAQHGGKLRTRNDTVHHAALLQELAGLEPLGQFQPETGEQEEFGMLFEKGSELRPCVDQALATLEEDGTLAAIEKKWLSDVVDVPVLE